MKKNTAFQTESTELFSFDPIVVVRDVAKRWLLILALAVAVGVATYIFTDMTYTPSYRSSATLVVTTRSSSASVYNNLSNTSALATVFEEVLNSSVFRKILLEETGLGWFGGSISAKALASTNLMSVQVTDTDPRKAFLVLQAILDHHQELTYDIIGTVTVEVLQKPTVPMAPVNPVDVTDRMQTMMVLAAAAVCLVLAWLSVSRDAVRSDKEARRKLDCRYLGQVPHEWKYRTLGSLIRRRKRSILITNPVTSFRFVEAVRKLRRRVEQRMKGRKVLMVTSLLENEGKSTVAVNLAMAMARKYKKVLLIDCDLRKPACHLLLQQQWEGPGVRDVLRGEVAVTDALLQDSASGIYMLLQRKGGKDSGDLLASANMARMVAWAREEFDAVILDLPPMAAATDAEAVADLADGSMLVVRQNAAVAPALNKAIAALSHGRAKMLGCVLNNVYSTALFSGQGYGGGYGTYGRYGKYGKYGKYGAYGAYGAYGSDDSKE